MENQQGGYIANPLTIPLAMASLLALVMGGLTVYFYAQNRDARQNIDDTKVLNQYKDAVEKKSLKASAIEINGIKGTRLDGKLDKDISGAIVILPIRDKVLKVWTESPAFLADFNQIVSGKLTFKP